MTNKNKSYVIEMYKTEESVNITTQEGNKFLVMTYRKNI